MLQPAASATSEVPHASATRARQRQRLLEQLRTAAEPLLEQLANTLVDAPDDALFGAVELQCRDLGQQLAARAQQTGLDDRKKGGM